MDISGITGAAGGLFMTVFRVISIGLVGLGLFFGTRMFAKNKKHINNFKINAFISNPDGSHLKCRIGKFKDKDGIQKMLFLHEVKGLFGIKQWKQWKGETMPVINPSDIVSLSVHLFRYGSSQYAVVPPTVYRNLKLDKFNISLINMHMLDFKGLEQRAGISRWAATKKSLQEFAPWILLGIIAIATGISVFFITKMAITEFARVTAARVVECSSLIGGGSAPLIG